MGPPLPALLYPTVKRDLQCGAFRYCVYDFIRLRNFTPVDIITTAVKSLEAGSRPLELEGQLPVINTVHVEPSGDADLK